MANETIVPTHTPVPKSKAVRRSTPAFTLEEARVLVEEWSRSGMIQSEFARIKGIKPQRLSRWKCLIARQSQTTATTSQARVQRSASPPRFVPVVVAATPTHTASPTAASIAAHTSYELALGDAMTLRIPHDFQDDALTRLVRVLRGAK
jgi:hypothetical protein